MFFFASCSTVHFDNSIPENSNVLKTFPEDLIGKYYFADSILKIENKEPLYNLKYFSELYKEKDSIKLILGEILITERQVYLYSEQKSYYNLAKFDSSIIALKHKKEKRRVDGKYLIFEESSLVDTILNLDNSDQLKFYDGIYYLNRFIQEKDWVVYQFIISGNNIFSMNLTNEQDEKAINNTTSRTIFYTIKHLSNKDFKRFIRNGGFREKYGLKKYPL